jgi:hypothetical protein
MMMFSSHVSKLLRSARSCWSFFLHWLTASVSDWFLWREEYLRVAGFGSLKEDLIRWVWCCATTIVPLEEETKTAT